MVSSSRPNQCVSQRWDGGVLKKAHHAYIFHMWCELRCEMPLWHPHHTHPMHTWLWGVHMGRIWLGFIPVWVGIHTLISQLIRCEIKVWNQSSHTLWGRGVWEPHLTTPTTWRHISQIYSQYRQTLFDRLNTCTQNVFWMYFRRILNKNTCTWCNWEVVLPPCSWTLGMHVAAVAFMLRPPTKAWL